MLLTENRLMQEEQLLGMLDGMREGVQIISYDWRYLYINNAIIQQSKYAKEELLGYTMMEKYPGIETTEMFGVLKDCMQYRVSQLMVNEFIYPDGSKGWFELSIQPVPEGLLILSVDITELKTIQEKLLKEKLSLEYTGQLEAYKEENQQSLRYAQRLQEAVMQEPDELKESHPESFILFLPKHIVSGDFYWFNNVDKHCLIAAGDCTGHGIPGALLTIMGMNILHAAFGVHKISSPPALLKFMDEDLGRKLSHKSSGKKIRDGMDITLCEIDREKMSLTVSGNNNPVYLVRDGVLQVIKTDKYSVGTADPAKQFESYQTPLQKGDTIYLFSDGYIDQFGGPNGKKFGSARFRELLTTIHKENIADQERILRTTLAEWQGKEEQTDDILIIGVKM